MGGVMYWISRVFLIWLFLAGQCYGTIYFVDSTTGDNADSGLTMDLAWDTIEYALESGGLVDGDIVFVRRIHQEWDGGNPISDIDPGGASLPKSPLYIIGWPRATTTLSSTDWTNGSTSVNADAGTTIDRETHQGRFVTGPDGNIYQITDSTDGDGGSFVIDREYVGTTASNETVTVSADDGVIPYVADMGTEYGFDDFGWTIKESDWDADAQTLPVIDFGDQSYNLDATSNDNLYFANLEIRDSAIYMFYARAGAFYFHGCLIENDNQERCIATRQCQLYINRCILEGPAAGAFEVLHIGTGGMVHIKDSAIYGGGDYTISFGQYQDRLYLDNVNIEVEGPKTLSAEDIYICDATVIGKNVRMGGTNGYINKTANLDRGHYSGLYIENFQKVLGAHKRITGQGDITSVAAGGGGDYPNQRSEGASLLVEVINDQSQDQCLQNAVVQEILPVIFEHEYEVTGEEAWSCKYYVQYHDDDDGGNTLTSDDIWIEAEYVSSYDDATEYVMTTVQSDESITDRDDADDWDQYLEIDSITPATDSKIRIKCYVRFYHASDIIYIDPLAVITGI